MPNRDWFSTSPSTQKTVSFLSSRIYLQYLMVYCVDPVDFTYESKLHFQYYCLAYQVVLNLINPQFTQVVNSVKTSHSPTFFLQEKG